MIQLFRFVFVVASLAVSSVAALAQAGTASVYGGGFCRKGTANGEHLNCRALTAAHRFLPFGTLVRVSCARTHRSVVVRINDRGPFVRGRIIDLSPAAARAIGMNSLAQVSLSVVGK